MMNEIRLRRRFIHDTMWVYETTPSGRSIWSIMATAGGMVYVWDHNASTSIPVIRLV